MRKIIINLAPADLPKEGGRFDLPIALGILAASEQIPHERLSEYEFVGELALSGELRPVRGILPIVIAAHKAGRKVIVPAQNAREAALVNQANVYVAKHLLDVCAYLQGTKSLDACTLVDHPLDMSMKADLSDVKGQPQGKRALEIAAAGKHSLLYIGPPGTGKTMLASRLPTILPTLSDEESLDVAAIASISSNGFDHHRWRRMPFRSPHHSSSSIALVGGGRPPRPGEISLAHRGVLFLDELPEFSRHVLDSLREPLESGWITISRASFQTIFPAQFQLIAAMNPCPCGYAGSMPDQCRCSAEQVKHYVSKISGPLLDRIDMQVEVARLPPTMLNQLEPRVAETSEIVRERVMKAHAHQLDRQGKLNAYLTVPELDKVSMMDKKTIDLLNQVMTKFNLSARVYHRIIKVARTIADLTQCDFISEGHVSEALNYRHLDRSRFVI